MKMAWLGRVSSGGLQIGLPSAWMATGSDHAHACGIPDPVSQAALWLVMLPYREGEDLCVCSWM